MSNCLTREKQLILWMESQIFWTVKNQFLYITNITWTLLPSSWITMDFFKWPLTCVSCLSFFFIICFLRWRIAKVKFFTPWYLMIAVLWKWGWWTIRGCRWNEPSSTQKGFPTSPTNGKPKLLAMLHYHPAGRTFTSDRSANSFIMVICENFFLTWVKIYY